MHKKSKGDGEDDYKWKWLRRTPAIAWIKGWCGSGRYGSNEIRKGRDNSREFKYVRVELERDRWVYIDFDLGIKQNKGFQIIKEDNRDIISILKDGLKSGL